MGAHLAVETRKETIEPNLIWAQERAALTWKVITSIHQPASAKKAKKKSKIDP